MASDDSRNDPSKKALRSPMRPDPKKSATGELRKLADSVLAPHTEEGRDSFPPEAQQRLRDAVELLVSLHRVSIEMTQAEDEKEMLRRAVVAGLTELQVDRMAIFLIEDSSMRGTWGTDERGQIIDESDFLSPIPEHPIVQQALVQKDYMAVNEDAPLYLRDQVVGTGWNAMVSLWTGEKALGWIACDNLLHQRPLKPFQREVLKLFGSAVAQMLERTRAQAALRDLNRELEERVSERTSELARANQRLEAANLELERISHQDGLTGIANRRYFDEMFKKEVSRARRTATSMSVVMIDVDHFKGVQRPLWTLGR